MGPATVAVKLGNGRKVLLATGKLHNS